MIKRLAPYIGQYKKFAVITPLLMTFEVVCELILPRLMAAIVDTGIPAEDVGYIVQKGLIMVLLALGAMACGVLASRFASRAARGFAANLREHMFHKIQTFSFADIDRFSSASLITRLTNDVYVLDMMLGMGLRIFVRAPVMMLASLFIVVRMNAHLSLVILAAIVLLAVAGGLLLRSVNRLFEAMQKRLDDVNDTLQENLTAIRAVKAFVREGYERTKFKKVNDAYTDAGLAALSRIILMLPIMTVILNGTSVAVVWFGGQMVGAGTMPLGDLSSYLTYITQILMNVLMLGMLFVQSARARACAERIIEVLDADADIKNPETPAPAPKAAGRVEFRHVRFKYRAGGSGDDVLEDINFTVEPGQAAALVGGTGTGKTSLVHLVPRFYDATEGAVLVDGVDVRDYDIDTLRSRIGMVLQSNVLFSGTIRENLLWGKPDATEEELVEAAKAAEAYDFIMSFPEGMDTWLEQGGVNVSGGQKQRLCIARAMLRRPAILILDDSTSAVDSATEAKIRTSFRRDLAGTTVIIIAQRISSVRYADKILVLDDGKIADAGTHEELLERCGIYREIYESQQGGVQE
ncbi:MAG TPA: ABC transporter ATP-binding protein [Oscillospiraceae bacterium]|nr:ABC transporter ATP-binding protein [Oscillospiraceae bacterium]